MNLITFVAFSLSLSLSDKPTPNRAGNLPPPCYLFLEFLGQVEDKYRTESALPTFLPKSFDLPKAIEFVRNNLSKHEIFRQLQNLWKQSEIAASLAHQRFDALANISSRSEAEDFEYVVLHSQLETMDLRRLYYRTLVETFERLAGTK